MTQKYSLRALVALLFIASCAISTGVEAKKHPIKKKPAKRVASQVVVTGPSYAQRLDAMQAADDIAQNCGLDAAWVRQTLAQARYIPAVAKAIAPPPAGVPKNWRVYRNRFIEPLRIKAGVAFWQANRETLLNAEAATGVPPEIIVGIVGVESIYGQQMGTFRVLDALATLAFDFPASHPRAVERSAYFKGELAQFLTLVQRNAMNPVSLLGSYAGAMGMVQFMPTSWAKYAIDFSGDGKVDLFTNPADAIGSVANYFKTFGWQSGLATHFPVSFDAQKLDIEALMAPDILPTFSVPAFLAKGAVLEGAALQHCGNLALIELQNGDAPPTYVAGTDNFYVITRYNWSSYYAMAVIELGQAVKRAVDPSGEH